MSIFHAVTQADLHEVESMLMDRYIRPEFVSYDALNRCVRIPMGYGAPRRRSVTGNVEPPLTPDVLVGVKGALSLSISADADAPAYPLSSLTYESGSLVMTCAVPLRIVIRVDVLDVSVSDGPAEWSRPVPGT